MLKTRARLAAWAEARQLGLTSAQSDLIADAALSRAIETLESWEAETVPCPRTQFNMRGYPKCNKPLQDYKCPQHGLIREAMPK